MSTPNVTFVRPELAALTYKYNTIRAALGGKEAMLKMGQDVLPMPNSADQSPANKKRYEAYLRRAVFYAVTGRTLEGMVGEIIANTPTIEVSTELKPVVNDASGNGVSLFQQSKKALQYNIAYGRGGLHVDYPKAKPGGFSKKDLDDGNVRPTINLYSPFHIINWRVVEVGAREVLSMVVLAEPYDFEDDGFEIKQSQQMRILYLDTEGDHRVRVYRPTQPRIWSGEKVLKTEMKQYDDYEVLDYRGNAVREIPFYFFGSLNNDPNPDLPPFYDLAELNLAHFRNSADYEESCFIAGQATPWASGLTEEWVKNVLGGGFALGATGGVPLPQGASFGIAQAQANSQPYEAMQHKERQMVALGARLVESQNVRRTLGEAKMDKATELSIVQSAAQNVQQAYQNALEACRIFTNQYAGKIEFSFTTDFNISTLSSDERKRLIEEWQQGAITFGEMRSQLKRAGVATLEDDAAQQEIQDELAKALADGVDDNGA